MMRSGREHIVICVAKDGLYMKFSVIHPPEIAGGVFDVTWKDLGELSDALRRAVERLCSKYRQDANEAEMLEAVRTIAQAGIDLRANLFGDDPVARKIADHLKRNGSQITFAVNYNVPVHPPYGLMYGYFGSNTASGKYTEEELRRGFWRDRHGVAVVYLTEDRTPSVTELMVTPKSLGSEGMEVFGAFHKGAIAHVKNNALPFLWKDRAAYSGRELKEQFTQRAGDTNLLYFFCHADGTKLVIGSDGDDDDYNFFWPYSLRSMILDRNPPPKGLIILNGCKTAAFRGNGDWLRAARAGGFLGFIGTEATIPTTFAWCFGNDLLKSILSGESTPLEALEVLWDRHWPLSLLYGLYSVANVRITPPVKTHYLYEINLINYSTRPYPKSEMASTLPFERTPINDGADPR